MNLWNGTVRSQGCLSAGVLFSAIGFISNLAISLRAPADLGRFCISKDLGRDNGRVSDPGSVRPSGLEGKPAKAVAERNSRAQRGTSSYQVLVKMIADTLCQEPSP